VIGEDDGGSPPHVSDGGANGHSDGGDLFPQMKLEEQRKLFQREQAEIVAPILIEDSHGVLHPAPMPDNASPPAAGDLPLTSLVAGTAQGRVVPIESDLEGSGGIVVVPDGSLRWLERLVRADGALFLGGVPVLGNLALAVMELGLPTLVGLTPSEAAAMAGRQASWSSAASDRFSLPDGDAPGRMVADVLIGEVVQSLIQGTSSASAWILLPGLWACGTEGATQGHDHEQALCY
jgi:hypothetical protein